MCPSSIWQRWSVDLASRNPCDLTHSSPFPVHAQECPALDRFCETSRRGISCYMSNLATCRGPLVEQHRREHGVTFCSPNWFWTVLSMGSPFSRLPHLPRLPCNGAVGKWNACLSDDRIPIFRLSRSYRYSILSRAVDARTYPRQGAVREAIA